MKIYSIGIIALVFLGILVGNVYVKQQDDDITLKMYWVRFYDMHGPLEVYLNWEGTNRYQVIDPTERLPDKYEVNVENQCPFDVEVKFTLMLDGQKVGNPDYWLETAILHPKGSYAYDPGLNVDQQARYLSLGDHTASWLVEARKAYTEDSYQSIFNDCQQYSVYSELPHDSRFEIYSEDIEDIGRISYFKDTETNIICYITEHGISCIN